MTGSHWHFGMKSSYVLLESMSQAFASLSCFRIWATGNSASPHRTQGLLRVTRQPQDVISTVAFGPSHVSPTASWPMLGRREAFSSGKILQFVLLKSAFWYALEFRKKRVLLNKGWHSRAFLMHTQKCVLDTRG